MRILAALRHVLSSYQALITEGTILTCRRTLQARLCIQCRLGLYWRCLHPCPMVGASHPEGLAQICAPYITGAGQSKLPGWIRARRQRFEYCLKAASQFHPLPRRAHFLPRNTCLSPFPYPKIPLCQPNLPDTGAANTSYLWQHCSSSTGVHMLYGTCVGPRQCTDCAVNFSKWRSHIKQCYGKFNSGYLVCFRDGD